MTFRTCCKNPRPDAATMALHTRFGRGPCVQYRCLECGGKCRAEVVHYARDGEHPLCGRKAIGRRTDEVQRVLCPLCAAELLAQSGLNAPVDWRSEIPVPEDSYVLGVGG